MGRAETLIWIMCSSLNEFLGLGKGISPAFCWSRMHYFEKVTFWMVFLCTLIFLYSLHYLKSNLKTTLRWKVLVLAGCGSFLGNECILLKFKKHEDCKFKSMQATRCHSNIRESGDGTSSLIVLGKRWGNFILKCNLSKSIHSTVYKLFKRKAINEGLEWMSASHLQPVYFSALNFMNLCLKMWLQWQWTYWRQCGPVCVIFLKPLGIFLVPVP